MGGWGGSLYSGIRWVGWSWYRLCQDTAYRAGGRGRRMSYINWLIFHEPKRSWWEFAMILLWEMLQFLVKVTGLCWLNLSIFCSVFRIMDPVGFGTFLCMIRQQNRLLARQRITLRVSAIAKIKFVQRVSHFLPRCSYFPLQSSNCSSRYRLIIV